MEKAVLRARKAIESTYDCTCTIRGVREIEKPNGANADEEYTLCENQPCKRSYQSFPQASDPAPAATAAQVIKLFLPPELRVPPGSIIQVEKNGWTDIYTSSGKPAVYDTHQEIILEDKERGI